VGAGVAVGTGVAVGAGVAVGTGVGTAITKPERAVVLLPAASVAVAKTSYAPSAVGGSATAAGQAQPPAAECRESHRLQAPGAAVPVGRALRSEMATEAMPLPVAPSAAPPRGALHASRVVLLAGSSRTAEA
jgi:hypothetical protein